MPVESDYAELKRRVHSAGLLNGRPGFYVVSIAVNLAMFVLCLLGFALVRNVWFAAADAVVLGLVSGQLGFQMHDAGHQQMFQRGWKNRLVGLLTADALLGMSYGWWVEKHNRHHANPNHVDMDPDINNVAIAYSSEQALRRRGPFRLMAKYQAFLFFPLLSLLGWSMHVQGARFLVLRKSRHRWLELGLLLGHAAVYVSLFVYLLGPWPALLVIVLHKAVGGFYMASVFAPNHKGMLQTDGDSDLDFLRSQVLTARNVRAFWLTDYWYGSLNFQIEHHLFPRMPRPSIRRAHVIVRQFCEELGVSYHETTMLQSYRELLGFLHEVGAPLREPAAS